MMIQDNLSNRTVSELKEIAGQVGCTGYSRLKKAELVELIAENLSDHETMKIFLTTIAEDEFKSFKKLCRNRNPYEGDLPSFEWLGYGRTQEDGSFCLAAEMAAFSMDELDKTFYRNRRYMQKLNCYLTAFVNLYGIVDLDTAVELLQKYGGLALTRNDLFVDAATLCMARNSFWVDTERVITAVLTDRQTVSDLWAGQQGKPYAVLPQAQLLCYVRSDYSPQVTEAGPVKRCLAEYFHLPDWKVKKIVDHISWVARTELHPGDVFDLLNAYGLHFAGMEDVQYFLGLYVNLHSHLPNWWNRGYSPAELPRK